MLCDIGIIWYNGVINAKIILIELRGVNADERRDKI